MSINGFVIGNRDILSNIGHEGLMDIVYLTINYYLFKNNLQESANSTNKIQPKRLSKATKQNKKQQQRNHTNVINSFSFQPKSEPPATHKSSLKAISLRTNRTLHKHWLIHGERTKESIAQHTHTKCQIQRHLPPPPKKPVPICAGQVCRKSQKHSKKKAKKPSSPKTRTIIVRTIVRERREGSKKNRRKMRNDHLSKKSKSKWPKKEEKKRSTQRTREYISS